MGMSATKAKEVLDGMTTIARKVYEAVPTMEEASVGRVHQELKRAGCALDMHTLLGCLAALVKNGLVREPRAKMFIRQHVKGASTPPLKVVRRAIEAPPAQAQMPQKAEEPMSEDVPMNELSELSAKIRSLSKAMAEVADAVDGAALSIAERIASSSEETQKLKQLQRLLKELG